MNDLLRIDVNENQEQTVSGRELHMFLGIETPYTMWIERMIEYGFSEGKDFLTKMLESTGGRPSTDHIMTLDMAKEICMLARNEKGKQARQYFLEVERRWNSPEQVMARGLLLADKTIKKLSTTIETQKKYIAENHPKVLFADSVTASQNSVLVGQVAKLIKQNGIDIGQNRLFQWMRENGYLGKNGNNYNLPTQKSMELGLYEIKENSHINSSGCVVVTRTVMVTGKGQLYFVNKFLGGVQNEG